MNHDPPTHISVELNAPTRRYTYFNHEPDIQAGDHVVVQLPSGRYAVGRVESTSPNPEACDRATKWIVQKLTIDTTKYDMLTALEPPASHKRAVKLTWARQALSAYREAYDQMTKGD